MLRYHLLMAERYRRVDDFLLAANDAIQPLEKSASNPLICNGRYRGACGLQVFDAGRDGEKKGPERVEWALGIPQLRSELLYESRYESYMAAGYPIASGVIEGACRHIIVDRMEHSGMRWVLEGAHAMVGMRCINLSGAGDEFTRFRIKRECGRLYPGYATNDEFAEQVA
jgi:hypothetical protein